MGSESVALDGVKVVGVEVWCRCGRLCGFEWGRGWSARRRPLCARPCVRCFVLPDLCLRWAGWCVAAHPRRGRLGERSWRCAADGVSAAALSAPWSARRGEAGPAATLSPPPPSSRPRPTLSRFGRLQWLHSSGGHTPLPCQRQQRRSRRRGRLELRWTSGRRGPVQGTSTVATDH